MQEIQVVPALIDLHVRPVLNEMGGPDVETIAVQARDRGLDGVAIIAADAAFDLGDTRSLTAATGIQLFVGVELTSEIGELLCFPRAVDDWYRAASWQALPRGNSGAPRVYAAAAVFKAFADRGGAVAVVPNAAAANADGAQATLIGATVVAMAAAADAGDAENGNEAIINAAYAARLACVGVSASGPSNTGFGAMATVFAAPPFSQESLVDGLRSGRVWPAEIGVPWPQKTTIAQAQPQQRRERPAPAANATADAADERAQQARADEQQARADRAAERKILHDKAIAERAALRAAQQAERKAKQDKRAKQDPFERPGDNRGNRLNRDDLKRQLVQPIENDEQPSFDPVAAMYGLDGRKQLRQANKSDIELDRINGNRNKGPDTNVMYMSFEDMRQERQHVSLLFAETEAEDQLEDSISLRFALSYYRQGSAPIQARDLPAAPSRRGSGGDRGRGRDSGGRDSSGGDRRRRR